MTDVGAPGAGASQAGARSPERQTIVGAAVLGALALWWASRRSRGIPYVLVRST
ncbi:hypothetical protein [Cellulomonas sp. P5_C6]